jgi:hypothetical protein
MVICPCWPVAVNAPVVAGTGRVGPRQKLHVSYSSQSEDEAPLHRIVVQPKKIPLSNDEVPLESSNIDSTASSALSKPPLPPSTGMKLNPKPKEQHFKRIEQGTKLRKQRGKKEVDSTELLKCVVKREEVTMVTVENCQKEIESGGDESWEDVTTTSGNESACEELSPCSNTDSTFDIKAGKLKSGMLHSVEVKSEILPNTEVAVGKSENAELKSELLQSKEAESRMVQNMESRMGLLQNTEVEPCMIQNIEVESGMLQNTHAKAGMLQADRNYLNNESEDFTEVLQIITNNDMPDAEMREDGRETLVSEGSTEYNGCKDGPNIYFEKSYLHMLVETKEETVNDAVDLEEKENMPQVIKGKEKMLEGKTKTELKNRCGQDEELGEVKVTQTAGSEIFSDGAAENCMLEKKQELI